MNVRLLNASGAISLASTGREKKGFMLTKIFDKDYSVASRVSLAQFRSCCHADPDRVLTAKTSKDQNREVKLQEQSDGTVSVLIQLGGRTKG